MLCLKHIQQIKRALGISGVNTIESEVGNNFQDYVLIRATPWFMKA